MQTFDIEKLRTEAEKARDAWVQRNLSDVHGYVENVLDGTLHDLIAKVLGMDRRWSHGEWEVDHCNGRSGNSIIGDEIRSQVQDAVRSMVLDAVKDVKLNAQQQTAIRKEYREHLMREMRKLAAAKASDDAGALLTEILESPHAADELEES